MSFASSSLSSPGGIGDSPFLNKAILPNPSRFSAWIFAFGAKTNQDLLITDCVNSGNICCKAIQEKLTK
jgi:hypothetical protein